MTNRMCLLFFSQVHHRELVTWLFILIYTMFLYHPSGEKKGITMGVRAERGKQGYGDRLQDIIPKVVHGHMDDMIGQDRNGWQE